VNAFLGCFGLQILILLFDEDMANSVIERREMLEDISDISRTVQEIRDVLKDEKGKAEQRPSL
jgi:hypothetical protein